MQNAFLSPEEEKPLKTCQNCKEQPCTIKGNPQYGKICDEVEALLPRPQAGHGNKIKHYAPEMLEDMANKHALRYKGLLGRKQPHTEE